MGKQAALEDHQKLLDVLEGSDMVFVTAGGGGGTGTRAAPVVASLAIELGALTVAVVTKPFTVEGKKRMMQAEEGIAELRGCVDTLITIPNSKLREVEEKIKSSRPSRATSAATAVQGITYSYHARDDHLDLPMARRYAWQGVALMGIGTGMAKMRASKAMRAARVQIAREKKPRPRPHYRGTGDELC